MPLMKGDKSRAATLIIRKMKGSDSADGMVASNERMSQAALNDEGAEDYNKMGLEAAAQDMMKAVKAEDTRSMVSALRAFIQMMEAEEEMMEDE